MTGRFVYHRNRADLDRTAAAMRRKWAPVTRGSRLGGLERWRRARARQRKEPG